MPGEATWQNYAGDAAYNAILGGMSTGGIVLASLAGFWTGEFTNSFTLARMKTITIEARTSIHLPFELG